MIAVITGDIINSRKAATLDWQVALKKYLQKKVRKPFLWQIYRGDSFQLETEVEMALEMVISIKALIKSFSGLDVRMSIGIGKQEQKKSNTNITEQFSEAHILSGTAFENIKNQTLVINSPSKELDDVFNTILKLVAAISNNWKPTTAETIFYRLQNPSLLQKGLAKKLEKDSTTINKALKRGAYEEIALTLELYTQKVKTWIH